MFFAINLLSPQQKGKFSLAWVVATRGIKHAKKKEILNCNIFQLCDELLKMVLSSSTTPRLRLSLSLSTRLINGTIKIYQRQVDILKDDLVKFLMQMSKPQADQRSITDYAEVDSKTSRRVVRKRKRGGDKQTEIKLSPLTPPPAEDVIVDREPLPQADPDLLQLQDGMCTGPRSVDDLILINNFGDLGDGQDPDILPQEAPLLPSEPPKTPVKRKSETANVGGTPSKWRLFLPMPEIQVTPAPEFEVPPAGFTFKVPQVPRRSRKRRSRKRRSNVAKKPIKDIYIRKYTGRIVCKKCNVVKRNQLFQLNKHESCPIMKNKFKNVNQYKVLENLMDDGVNIEDMIAKIGERTKGSSLKTPAQLPHIPEQTSLGVTGNTPVLPSHVTLQGERVQGYLQPHQISVQADVHISATEEDVAHPSLPTSKRLEVTEPISKPLAESTGISKHLMIRAPMEQLSDCTHEMVAPPVAFQVVHQRENVIESPTESEEKGLRKNRQKRIRDIVKNWDSKAQGAITIEDVCVCPPPHICSDMSNTFYDLLCLNRMGYVKLITCESAGDVFPSMELDTIEKGERILRKQ